jgi:putative membrane protein
MQVASWLQGRLRAEDVDLVVEAIREAESSTSGEIVPMIVRRSSTVGHVPVLLATLLVAAFFALGGPAWQADLLGPHWAWFLADLGAVLLLTALGARQPWLQRWLTPRADQVQQVEARAMLEFYQSNLQRTTGATGVLIFVSLLERQAVVLADKAVNDRVPTDTWTQVCERLVTGLKAGRLGPSVAEAVQACGSLMTPLFPIGADDVNELKNQLIVKE